MDKRKGDCLIIKKKKCSVKNCGENPTGIANGKYLCKKHYYKIVRPKESTITRARWVKMIQDSR